MEFGGGEGAPFVGTGTGFREFGGGDGVGGDESVGDGGVQAAVQGSAGLGDGGRGKRLAFNGFCLQAAEPEPDGAGPHFVDGQGCEVDGAGGTGVVGGDGGRGEQVGAQVAAVAGDGAAFAGVGVDPLFSEVGEADVAATRVEIAAGDYLGVEFADEVFGVAAGEEASLGELVAGVGVEPADLEPAG